MAHTKRWPLYFSSYPVKTMSTTDNNKGKTKLWLKRAGIAGFLFFLVKGLIWIGVAVWAGKALFD